MNFEEFLSFVLNKYHSQSDPKELRLGQIFFNELCVARPAIAEEIRGTMLDPFFKERITKVVLDVVSSKW